MGREVLQGLYLRLAGVEFLQRRIQLGRDITDKLSLQGVVLIRHLDGVLLFPGQQDETHQHDSAHHQGCSQSRCQHTKADDNRHTRRQ